MKKKRIEDLVELLLFRPHLFCYDVLHLSCMHKNKRSSMCDDEVWAQTPTPREENIITNLGPTNRLFSYFLSLHTISPALSLSLEVLMRRNKHPLHHRHYFPKLPSNTYSYSSHSLLLFLLSSLSSCNIKTSHPRPPSRFYTHDCCASQRL